MDRRVSASIDLLRVCSGHRCRLTGWCSHPRRPFRFRSKWRCGAVEPMALRTSQSASIDRLGDRSGRQYPPRRCFPEILPRSASHCRSRPQCVASVARVIRPARPSSSDPSWGYIGHPGTGCPVHQLPRQSFRSRSKLRCRFPMRPGRRLQKSVTSGQVRGHSAPIRSRTEMECPRESARVPTKQPDGIRRRPAHWHPKPRTTDSVSDHIDRRCATCLHHRCLPRLPSPDRSRFPREARAQRVRPRGRLRTNLQ